jgi:3-phenylpropionate/trans-cinnamate dioxygenase ferredoxin subunit
MRGALDALDGTAATPSVAPEGSDAWTRVCSLDELPAGSRKTLYFQSEQVLLLNVDGTVYAIEARCPHASGPLAEGTIEGTVLTCPSHGSRFDLATCDVVRGPASRPLRSYAVRVLDGSVFLGTSELVGATASPPGPLSARGEGAAEGRG